MNELVGVRCGVLLALFLSTGCTEALPDSTKGSQPEKRYYLKDCVVRIDFAWQPSVGRSEKESVLSAIGTEMNRAMVSGAFPPFSGHRTNTLDYYLLYYGDRCEEKEALTYRLVKEALIPSIPSFPRYSVRHAGIEPGFDGVLPSGWWKDR